MIIFHPTTLSKPIDVNSLPVDIAFALRSETKHFTLTVSLSTQALARVYLLKLLGSTLRQTNDPSSEE